MSKNWSKDGWVKSRCLANQWRVSFRAKLLSFPDVPSTDLRLTFDKSSKKLEDILSVHGFFQCLQHTLRLEEFGLLFSGVPCNSFTWISSSQHQRAEWNDFMGDTSYEWVEMMNIVAVRTAICLAVALARKCYFMIENPRQSTLPNFPYYDYLLQVANCLDILAGHCDQLQCTYWWLNCIYMLCV